MARFDWVQDGARRAVFRACAIPPASPSQVACFAMLPWANRVQSEGFSFDGHAVVLPANRQGEPCPIHGEGWQSAWDIDYQSETEVRLSLDRRGCAPFAYQAVLHYSLLDTALRVRLEVTNCGAHALPFGLGLHPWFARSGGELLHAAASCVWKKDGRGLPAEKAALPVDWNFASLRDLTGDAVDHVFGGWDGQAKICLPEQGIALRIGSDMEYFILYAPKGADFFCFEPLDHLPNGQAAAPGLAPGCTTRRTVVFAVDAM